MASGRTIDPEIVSNGVFFDSDIPHKLSGRTLLDGSPVRRRIVVRRRRSGDYVISGLSNADGTFSFRHLPRQYLSDPYIVSCFDDRVTEYGNALVIDHVYQVNDAGEQPES